MPIFGPGGGRVLFSVEGEKMVQRDLFPPLPPNAPKPSADPRNFEGAWGKDQPAIARIEWDAYGNEVPFSARGKRVRQRRIQSTYIEQKPYSNASGLCRPTGQPWLFGMYYPFQIYQTGREIHFLFAYGHAVWTVRLDQPHRDASAPREYMGDSIGHWDGDTLVVETVNFRDRLWLDFDGTPASRDARLVFRIRRIDEGGPKLEIATTVHDPANYTRPWSFLRTFAWRPDKHIMEEYNCELQVADAGAGAFGLIEEPEDE